MFRLFFKFLTVFSTFVCLLFQVPDGVAAQSYSHLLNIVNNSWAQKQIQNIFSSEKIIGVKYQRKIPETDKYFFRVKKLFEYFYLLLFVIWFRKNFQPPPPPFLPIRNFSLNYELTFSSKRNKGPFKCKGLNVNYKTNWSHAYSKISFFVTKEYIFILSSY